METQFFFKLKNTLNIALRKVSLLGLLSRKKFEMSAIIVTTSCRLVSLMVSEHKYCNLIGDILNKIKIILRYVDFKSKHNYYNSI